MCSLTDSYLNVPDGVGPSPIHIFYTYGNLKCVVKLFSSSREYDLCVLEYGAVHSWNTHSIFVSWVENLTIQRQVFIFPGTACKWKLSAQFFAAGRGDVTGTSAWLVVSDALVIWETGNSCKEYQIRRKWCIATFFHWDRKRRLFSPHQVVFYPYTFSAIELKIFYFRKRVQLIQAPTFLFRFLIAAMATEWVRPI